VRIYNTLTQQKEEFVSRGQTVTMYVCGVTVYSSSHIGHAMSYLVFDVVRRYLEFKGFVVKHVQNFTDVDDKIINRANQLGIPPMQLSASYVDEYFADADALNIRRATQYPKATEEMAKIIEVIQGLIDKGFAYPSQGDVYFRVGKDDDYGKLSHQGTGQMLAGARVESSGKENPLDFALWKSAKPGEPSWPSPWGGGRPGWHIECSAMSMKYLGDTIDIHGGGQDLIFPHHENEIAQSESFSGHVPFVRYWMHNGLLQLGEQKMSKSLGNLITIKELLQHFSADAVRLFMLSSHYRSPLTYSDEAVESAERGAERLRQAMRGTGEATGSPLDPAPFKGRFVEAMEDDFNTPQAIAVLFELAREINRGQEARRSITRAQEVLRELAGILGFTLRDKGGPSLEASDLAEIEKLVKEREEHRKAKQWALADSVRQKLLEQGIVLEDTPKGTVWKRAK
jgi:cysteinyl-tRNA synthetase